MKISLCSARTKLRLMVLAGLTLISVMPSRAAILPNDTCSSGAQCPGAPFLGSTVFAITENGGVAVPLFDPSTGKTDTVYSGDVLIYEGGILSDLLRFPEEGGQLADDAVLYSADDPGAGAIPTDRQALVVSINENRSGIVTTYTAKTGRTHSIDYQLTSPEPLDASEPGTAALLGVTGFVLVVGLRRKAAKNPE